MLRELFHASHITRHTSHITRHTSHVTFTFVAAATSPIPSPVACSEVWGLGQRALRRILMPSRWALSGYAEHALLKGALRSRTHRAAAPAKPGYMIRPRLATGVRALPAALLKGSG